MVAEKEHGGQTNTLLSLNGEGAALFEQQAYSVLFDLNPPHGGHE
jgi:hypothetical protein